MKPLPARPVLACAFIALLGAGCASQVPPAGGPADTDPPEIVSTVPVPGELNYHGERFIVRFSEYVDKRSFQESVFLSPPAGRLGFEWSSTEVAIVPSDTLMEAVTYNLTVGTDLKDTRNNRLAGSFTLPFSTGGVIDSCAVSGRVYDESPVGVMIYAYAISENGPDTLNPATARPDYLTQTGSDGTYSLTNMKYGRYRIIAVRDVFKNLLYNVQTDMYGMPRGDIRLSPSARGVDGLIFTLASEDTLRPYLTTARAVDRARVIVRFNEPPDRVGLREGITVRDTLTGSGLKILDFSPADSGGREYRMVTDEQDSGAVYRLALGDMADRSGNRADSAGRTITFAGGTGRDTVAPILTLSIPRDSVTGVLPGAAPTMHFNEAVDTAAFARGFSLWRPPALRVPGLLSWQGSMLARFEPDSLPDPGAWYEIRIAPGSVRNLRGNTAIDSGLTRRYRILEEKYLGSIEGSVVPSAGRDSLAGASSVVVTSRELSGARGRETIVNAGRDGKFFIGDLPEGRYVIAGFLDVNGNRAFDPGKPFPVSYAEKFFVYPDTVKIRPGWPVGGVRLGIGN